MNKESIRKAVLVDDSDIDLFIQKRFLEVNNFSQELELFNSARAALSYLKQTEEAPEVIFLDLNMPEADGFTFLKNFSTLPPHISKKSRIVVLTSSESHVDRDYVLTFSNVIGFIAKPLKQTDIEDLRSLLA